MDLIIARALLLNYLQYPVLFGLLYVVTLVVYRLTLSPLARFPGPRLAAATGLYEAYYQVVKDGIFTWKINSLHGQYGPIVRIKPNELHIRDPDYYDTLYSGPGTHRNKDAGFSFIAFPKSLFSTEEHELHRDRRRVLGQFLKKNAIQQIEPAIHANIELLGRHFSSLVGSTKSLELHTAFECFTADTLSQYCFGKQEGFHYLEQPELSTTWKLRINWMFEFCRMNRQFPFLVFFARVLPWLATKVCPPYGYILGLEQDIKGLVRQAIDRHQTSSKTNRGSSLPGASTAIYPTILADPTVPRSEKELSRLEDDAIFLMMAGTDAPSQALAITMFHILNNPDAHQKLKAELFASMPEASSIAPLETLEQLPFLSATIKEGLRLSSIVTTRLPRIAPHETLQYKQWSIPAGTPVSMSTYFILRDSTIFPDPTRFLPERWLLDPETLQRQQRYLVPASKGTLGCLGQNLNSALMYLVLGTLFRRYDLALFETTEENVRMVKDNFIGQTGLGLNNVRVRVLSRFL
ncbi:cytochrome P450 [Aspergillus homomorphus CBS 101889]|uniref:Benzoate 4-monooxygenase cytochrome P450 n=1 Tax=Aspergillus homomorphus (strain CBS 101889) TaxID=1450537 RepID=A0A395I249_ASPHC|nr:benzoate 4-monooxygenase cytochrome P450 [Aspergillus homomorphus CBS 101889]RAL13759.1 benzoate 4-monooxygenase cytochrome P450 [Aspergillus homomorphus CBS 101889]